MPAAYAASPSVRHVVVSGLRIVLDLERERYRVLDEPASLLWAVLTGELNREDAVRRLTAKFDVHEAQLDAEFTAFADRCLLEGILVEAGARPASSMAKPPRQLAGGLTLRAWLSLFLARRALARDGFRRTYERYACIPTGAAPVRLDRALRAFTHAENGFLSRRAPDDCLVRSLALFRFLRGAGLPVQHVIGVQRVPFSAHAWVEHNSEPLLGEAPLGFDRLAVIGDPAPA